MLLVVEPVEPLTEEVVGIQCCWTQTGCVSPSSFDYHWSTTEEGNNSSFLTQNSSTLPVSPAYCHLYGYGSTHILFKMIKFDYFWNKILIFCGESNSNNSVVALCRSNNLRLAPFRYKKLTESSLTILDFRLCFIIHILAVRLWVCVSSKKNFHHTT